MCEGDKRFNYWIGSPSLRSLCEIIWNNSLQIYSWNVSSLHIFSLCSHKQRDGFFSKCIYLGEILAAFLYFLSFFSFFDQLWCPFLKKKKCTKWFLELTLPACEWKVWLFLKTEYLFSFSTSWCSKVEFFLILPVFPINTVLSAFLVMAFVSQLCLLDTLGILLRTQFLKTLHDSC